MKIKNLAFFGIMAAILGVNGAAHADSTTIIASQAYVDAKDALKQDKDNRVQTSQADYEAISGLTDTKRKEDYPSMYTLKQAIASASSDASNMKDTAASATWDDNDHELDIVTTADTAGNKTDKVATSNQVQTSISALKTYTDYTKQAKSTANYSMGKSDGTWEAMSQGQQNALNSGIDSTKVAQIATNTTNISNNAEAIDKLNQALEKGLTNAQEKAYNDWVDPEKGKRLYEGQYWTDLVAALATDVDNVVSDYQKDHQNLIPRNRNIQKGIAYLKGNGIENYTPGVTNDASADVGIKNGTVKEKAIEAWNDNLNKHGDEFVPTVASVERRVQEAQAAAISAAGTNASNLKDTTDAATTASGATTLTVHDGDDDHFYTADAVEAGFTAVNDAIGNMALTAADATTASSASTDAVVEVTQLDGQIAVKTGKLTAAALDSTAKATSGSGNNNLDTPNSAVDTKLVTEKAVADALNGKANAQTVTDNDANANSLVTVNSQGVVTGKIAAGALAKKNTIGNSDVTGNSLEYKDTMNYALSNVDTTGGDAHERCTLKSPCTLTMIWKDSKPVYEWTNMDTEDTEALL